MRKLLAMFALIFVATIGWRIVEGLSTDAQAIIVTVAIIAGAATATVGIVLASDRRQRAYDETYHRPHEPLRSAEPPRIENHTHYHLHGQQSGIQAHQARQKIEADW